MQLKPLSYINNSVTRTVNPTKPREAVSIDILYFPKSTKGHTHGLLIADLYSMYLSFYPLKSKSSETIATALRSYISTQGVPRIVYSDNDPSFKQDVEELFTTYHIQHATSYPHTQRENAVESAVILRGGYPHAYISIMLSGCQLYSKKFCIFFFLLPMLSGGFWYSWHLECYLPT